MLLICIVRHIIRCVNLHLKGVPHAELSSLCGLMHLKSHVKTKKSHMSAVSAACGLLHVSAHHLSATSDVHEISRVTFSNLLKPDTCLFENAMLPLEGSQSSLRKNLAAFKDIPHHTGLPVTASRLQLLLHAVHCRSCNYKRERSRATQKMRQGTTSMYQ